ncbi:hypothetical protein K450DRAFT_221180 [Umbelopsis ramanniana AG]|uniref:Uncharacterized protein n=1 Tax=Umbelopsis ramanniana AG TaxID=1314678 RepID=A0AAD5EJ47_UMBRA|nr:uncharacterized protein K450DRAFT_221180 [Umbelopsis ramanniana AG]KAI8584030.1 hypothetical protein K450DRAFT_221180 [Umbelopsis ramanniana AG]
MPKPTGCSRTTLVTTTVFLDHQHLRFRSKLQYGKSDKPTKWRATASSSRETHFFFFVCVFFFGCSKCFWHDFGHNSGMEERSPEPSAIHKLFGVRSASDQVFQITKCLVSNTSSGK